MHAERISIASVKGVNRAILDRRAKLASELSRRAQGPLGAYLENRTPCPFFLSLSGGDGRTTLC